MLRVATAMSSPRWAACGGHHANFGIATRATHIFAWWPPYNQRHAPHHATHASMAGRHAAAIATTWRSASRRTSCGASRHDYIFQTSFLSPHNLFVLPLPYSSHYPLPSFTSVVPIGTCQVFRLQFVLRAPIRVLLVCSVVRVICAVGVC